MTITCSSSMFTKQTDTITNWLPICWGSTFLHHHFSCVGWGPRPIWPLMFVLPSKGLESSFTKVHDPRTPPVVRIEPKAWKIEKVGKKTHFFHGLVSIIFHIFPILCTLWLCKFAESFMVSLGCFGTFWRQVPPDCHRMRFNAALGQGLLNGFLIFVAFLWVRWVALIITHSDSDTPPKTGVQFNQTDFDL